MHHIGFYKDVSSRGRPPDFRVQNGLSDNSSAEKMYHHYKCNDTSRQAINRSDPHNWLIADFPTGPSAVRTWCGPVRKSQGSFGSTHLALLRMASPNGTDFYLM